MVDDVVGANVTIYFVALGVGLLSVRAERPRKRLSVKRTPGGHSAMMVCSRPKSAAGRQFGGLWKRSFANSGQGRIRLAYRK